jgi:hypothetical protein
MQETHGDANPVIEPHGLLFRGLSVVESPEEPGVQDTHFELVETMQPQQCLYETIIHDFHQLIGDDQMSEQTKESNTADEAHGKGWVTRPSGQPATVTYNDRRLQREEDNIELKQLRAKARDYDTQLEQINQAYQQYKHTMETGLQHNLESLSGLLKSFEQRLIRIEALVNVNADNRLDESRQHLTVQEALITRIENLEDKLKQLAVFKAPQKIVQESLSDPQRNQDPYQAD